MAMSRLDLAGVEQPLTSCCCMSAPSSAPAGPRHLWLGGLLAAVAGSVDAIALASTGHFASHMSGTTSASVRAAFQQQIHSLLLLVAVLAAFVAGAAIAGSALARCELPASPLRLRSLLTAEWGLIGGAAALWRLADPAARPFVVIPALAAAMGLQNTLSRRGLYKGMRTTHVTGALSDFGAGVGGLLRCLLAADLPASPHRTFALRGAVVFGCFVLSGCVAVEVQTVAGIAALLLPLGGLAVAIILVGPLAK